MFKSGDLVRHRSKPEWGVGRITGLTGEGKVLVKFASRSGDVLLTAEGADAHLVVDTGAVGAFTPQAVRHVAPVRRTPCVTCSTDIRRVVTSRDGTWRSCTPARRGTDASTCLPFPAAFDVIDLPLATTTFRRPPLRLKPLPPRGLPRLRLQELQRDHARTVEPLSRQVPVWLELERGQAGARRRPGPGLAPRYGCTYFPRSPRAHG
ncbi:MAG: DUF3553 domain-containing protein [Vicinamibacterales bacterium]